MYPEARDWGFKLLTCQRHEREIGQMIYLKIHFGSLIDSLSGSYNLISLDKHIDICTCTCAYLKKRVDLFAQLKTLTITLLAVAVCLC